MPLPWIIVLSVLGALLLLFLLLLIIPAKIRIKTKEQLTLTVSFLLFRFKILPKKQKKFKPRKYTKKKLEKIRRKEAKRAEKRALKAAKKKQKKGPPEEKTKRKRKKTKAEKELAKKKRNAVIENLPEGLQTLIKILDTLSSTFLSRIRVKLATLHIYVGSPDPAKTAYTYVVICTAMNTAVTFLQKKSHINKFYRADVLIVSDFLREKTEFEADISVSLNLFGLLWVIIRLLFDLITTAVKFRPLIETITEKLPEPDNANKESGKDSSAAKPDGQEMKTPTQNKSK